VRSYSKDTHGATTLFPILSQNISPGHPLVSIVKTSSKVTPEMPKLIATGASPSEVGAKAAKSEPILTWDNLTYSVNNGAKTIIDDCSGEMYSTLNRY